MVSRDPRSALFRKAAEPTLERIRRDRERVPEPARPLMAFIEERLFDQDLELRLGKRLETLSDDVVRDFCAAFSQKPHEYVRDRRVDVGDRLLRSTDWTVSAIAHEVGFRSYKAFSKAYKARMGVVPSSVRPAVKARPREGKLPKIAAAAVLTGASEPKATVALVQRIRSLYPSVPRREASRPRVALSRPGFRRDGELAEALWSVTQELPAERRRRLLCQRLRFESPALFQLLGAKGREIGRRDRARGLALVELAVEVLEANAEAFGEKIHDLLTVAWARIANQRRLALDHSGGEEALGFARQEWETQRARRDSLVEAEFRFYEGTLRLFQRRLGEAAKALGRSIDLSRECGDSELLVKALLQRAELARQVDDPQRAADDLRDVLESYPDQEQDYLTVAIYMSLIGLYMRLDQLEKIAGLFDAVEPLARSVASPLIDAQLLWLRGLLCQRTSDLDAAESLFLEAHTSLVNQGETSHASVLALDLMELYLVKDQAWKVRELAVETLAILETMKLHREILAAMRILRSALERDEVDLITISTVRKKLRPLKNLPLERAG